MSRQELLRSYIEAGLQAHNQGDIGAAQAAYQQALAIAPDNPDAMHLLGVALLQLGQLEPALDYLERAAHKQRNNAAIAGNLGHAYFAAKRYAESQEAFRHASRLDPSNTQFQVGIATSLAMQGKLREAETRLRTVTVRFPQSALAWLNLGHVLRDERHADEALASYRRALELDPRSVDARSSAANVLHGMQRFEDAEREFRACLGLAPDDLRIRCNLASVIIDLGHFREAEDLCREIITAAPQFALARTFLGTALRHQGRVLEALECHRVAVEISPEDITAVDNYAGALADAGRVDEGLRWLSRGPGLKPNSTAAREALGLALLRHGRLAEGWLEYGYRTLVEQFREKHPNFALSRTLPTQLDGRHVCVLQEQGLGDEIFFLRYVPQLQAAGARITYRASDKISSLLKRVSPIHEVLGEAAPLPVADVIILAGDLPRAVSAFPASTLRNVGGNTHCFADFPRRPSIFWPQLPPPLALTPLEQQIAMLRQRLAETGDGPYCGLTWRSGVPPREQRGVAWALYKEIEIGLLAAALKDFPGTFLALQRNPLPGEIEEFERALGRRVYDFTDLNDDLEGMLALLAEIDEYVGVSNTNMHLRASVGKSARVLVPCPAEWRWMAAGRSSPWFPGFTIYRQSLQGDWDAALAALKRDLAQNPSKTTHATADERGDFNR